MESFRLCAELLRVLWALFLRDGGSIFGGKFKFKIATQKSPTSYAIISTTITIQNLL